MGAPLQVAICSHHRAELDRVLADGDWADVEVLGAPASCDRPAAPTPGGHPALALVQPEGLCLLGGPCLGRVAPAGSGALASRHCLENLVDAGVLRSWMMEGAYVVSPGWLRGWRARVRGWGFDQETAQRFFAESASSVLLLDTGVDPEAAAELEAFASHVGRPRRRVEVGVEHLRGVLRERVLEHRLEAAARRAAAATSADRERSTYALAFAQLGALAGLATEREVVERIFDLFSMLWGARSMQWAPADGGAPQIRGPAVQGVGGAPGSGMSLPVQGPGMPLGVLHLPDAVPPGRRDERVNLGLALAPVLALAVRNARTWQELTRARELLARQAEGYRVLANSADGLLVVGADGLIRFANPAARSLIGHGAGDALAVRLEPGRIEVADSEGQTRRVDVRLAPLDWEGEPARLASLRDVTEQDAAEEAVRSSQKMTLLGQLAGSVAHDFNNVLQAVSGALELAAEPGLGPQDTAALIQEAAGAADRGTRIARRLLLLSRPGAEPPRFVDVAAELQRMDPLLRMLAADRAEIVLDTPAGPLGASCGDGQLEAIVLNLVTNARDATDRGGRIEVILREEERDGAPHLRLSVVDDGEGIPPERLRRIFEPFFTTKSPDRGTGLGLPTVAAAVQRMSGEVAVTSRLGEGTRFDVWLPRAAPPEAPAEQGRPEETKTGGGVPGRILVVDDERAIRELLAAALARAGHAVEVAADGAEGLARLEGADPPFDLLITDVSMPGMDGFELALAAESATPGLPVVLMSGLADVSFPGLGLDPVAVRVLAKPFRLAEATACVEAALTASRLASS